MPGWLRFASMLGLAAIIIAVRRWPQFVHPDVWVEDGTQVIPSFIESGWLGLFTPVSGYLVVPAKLVSFAALSISFVHYAITATLLATLVQSACVAAVATAPTLLPARRLCALAVVCVPTGTEVFALPLYTIWWTTLLVVVALLWDGPAQWLRVLLLAVGASSSPLVVAVAPLFLLRAGLQRRREDILVCGAVLVFAGIQGAVFFGEPVAGGGLLESLLNAKLLIIKFFGGGLYTKGWPGAFLLGCLMLLTLGAGALSVPRKDRLGYGLLGLFLWAAILSALLRVPVTGTHPLFAGARYFFYSTIAILWLLIWIWFRASRFLAMTAAALMACYLPALLKVFDYSRVVPKQPWPQQAAVCLNSDSATFEIQYGDPTVRWDETLSGDACRRLNADAALP